MAKSLIDVDTPHDLNKFYETSPKQKFTKKITSPPESRFDLLLSCIKMETCLSLNATNFR